MDPDPVEPTPIGGDDNGHTSSGDCDSASLNSYYEISSASDGDDYDHTSSGNCDSASWNSYYDISSDSDDFDDAPSGSINWVPYYVSMGFKEEQVKEAINNNEEGNRGDILETLLNYGVLEIDSVATDGKLATLIEMGFSVAAASFAIHKCGKNATVSEIIGYLCTMSIADIIGENPENTPIRSDVDVEDGSQHGMKRTRESERSMQKFPKPMTGFGLPGTSPIKERELDDTARGPPFFYYENVALAPRGVWDTISKYLGEIEPEFYDSKFLCATARKRGYIHNLPIKNRQALYPSPPKNMKEAFPEHERWRPKWDERKHFNCLLTSKASSTITVKIQKLLSNTSDPPASDLQKLILKDLKRYNLVWIKPNIAAPLSPEEMEKLLGFPIGHTREMCTTNRYKALGNSFQVDTVAFHLSVLKEIFPEGINVLSLFSGIGGAEVALHRLKIHLKLVVSVEKCKFSQGVLKNWWEETNQSGTLIHVDDVQEVTVTNLGQYYRKYGGFDLVIGGSPCNNLAGSNRYSRDGLEGQHSSLFFEYFRILEHVKFVIRENKKT